METKKNESRFLADEQRKNNWAIYLPALQPQQVMPFSKLHHSDKGRGGMKHLDWLRFMDDNHPRALEYDWALYSAANGIRHKSDKANFITERSPNSILVGDSGGYQIATGNLVANWKDPNNHKASELRKKIKHWLCVTTDYAMCLDVPVLLLKENDNKRKAGCYTFQDCLDATLINNDYFIKPCTHFLSKTKFLNVIQATNAANASIWYNAVKHYCDPTKHGNPFRGWSFAGEAKYDIRVTLQRISEIIHDNLLQSCIHDWIHFLGVGTLSRATMYSYIQQSLRKHHNPNVTISFDTSATSQVVRSSEQYTDACLQHSGSWQPRTVNNVAGSQYCHDTRTIDEIVKQDYQPLIFSRTLLGEHLCGKDMCSTDCHRGNKWDNISYYYQTVNQLAEQVYNYHEANRKAEEGIFPGDQLWNGTNAKAAIEDVLSKQTHKERLHTIDHYLPLWEQMRRKS